MWFARSLHMLGAVAALSTLATTAPLQTLHADDGKLDSDTFEGLHARALGPGTTSGRITCIDGVSGDRVTLWVGSAGGGVWRSKDGGTTFRPVFDKYCMSIGAIRVAPSDAKTVWVGTGESWTRNSVGVGDGVYKTTDGGDNWTRMGLEKTERIARIRIDAKHPDTVYVAATGALFNSSPDRGVYRTRDGGRTWAKVLFVNDDTGAADIAMDPQDSNTLYASMWQFRRKAWTFSSGGPGSGLYKSTDGGDTWRRLSSGLPDGDLGRIGIDVSPARASRVYAAVESKSTAFYRSDDCGEHWTKLNDSNMSVTWRPFYFANVVADPKDFARVYKSGLNMSVSDDAGKTFGSGGGGASYHSDTHALWIDPKNTDWMAMGTDGGVYVSQDRAATWRLIENIPVGQFYHVSYDMKWPYYVYGGLQDNGSWRAPSRNPGGIANRLWENLNGGDGMWAFVDPKNEDVCYSEYQGGEISRSSIATGERKSIKPLRTADEPKLRFNWNAPVHLSPSRDGTIYMGSQFLFRSRDRGDTWERISPDLTTNDPLKQQQEKSGGLSIDNSAAENHCTIYAIGESPKDPNVVYVGTDDGNVQVTRDGGKTWANVTKHLPGLPANTWISYVAPSTFDAGTCFLSADGHMLGDMTPHLYVTHDYGATWASLASGEPAGVRGYAHVIRQDDVNPDLLFAGTESGLFCSLDGGKQWAQIHAGIPNVAVRDLAIHPREGDLLVATHGRGIFIIDDLTPLRSLSPKVLAADGAFLETRPSVLAIPASEQRFDGDTDYAGDNVPESAIISYYLKKRHIIGDLKLQVFDPAGKLLTTIDGGKRRGINRVEWPMRMKGPKIPPAANLVPNSFAFVGPRVAAGEYTVKLIRNKDTYESKIRLVTDPRSTHSADDRAAQVRLVRRLYDMLNDLSYTVESVADLRDQARERAKDRPKGDALAAKLKAFADKLEAFRGTIVAAKEGGRLTGEERLREQLGDLYGKLNGYDGKPGASQEAYAGVLEKELGTAMADFRAMVDRELPAINSALASRKLAELKTATRAEWDEEQAKS